MLNRQEIERLTKEKQLITGYSDLDTQLTPNGFDLTVGNIFEFSGVGVLDFSNKKRLLPETRQLSLERENSQDEGGWWNLSRGVYKVRSNETINLPSDLIAIAFPRSSLLRMGAFTQTGVWDAGFKGKSEFILLVGNPFGLKIQQNARVIQIIFIKINETNVVYQGIYQDKDSGID